MVSACSASPRRRPCSLAVKITSRDFKRARPGGLRLEIGRWREFGFGLAVGLSLSVCVLIWQNYREKNVAGGTLETPKPQPRAVAAADTEEPAKSFDFYDRLPSFEVVVPEKDREAARERDTAPATITRPGVYVLQAGSYRRQEDADRIQ